MEAKEKAKRERLIHFQIASELFVFINTIYTYIQHIYFAFHENISMQTERKLKLKNNIEAIGIGKL